MRTVEWNYKTNCLRLIDQRLLPNKFHVVELDTPEEVANAIRDMVVRGAPAIGATAGFGLAVVALHSRAGTVDDLHAELRDTARLISAARPTAVNLAWALQRILRHCDQFEGSVGDLRHEVLSEAQRLADEDVQINLSMARHGAQLIENGDTIIHHCNTGALAVVDWGTALGVIRLAHQQGKRIHVLVDETRPRLQGARLTAWELKQYGIPFDLISDNAAGYFLQTRQANKVFFGADRVAANGDVANKIGSYMLSLAAYDNGVPVYPVVPTSTVDLSLPDGNKIPIEERNQEEVIDIQIAGKRVVPRGVSARNPAFDITPHRLVRAIVTENGIVYPPFSENLAKVVRGELL